MFLPGVDPLRKIQHRKKKDTQREAWVSELSIGYSAASAEQDLVHSAKAKTFHSAVDCSTSLPPMASNSVARS